MIASLSGLLKEKAPGLIVVDTGGVGYGVTVPLSSYYELPETGKKVSLLILTLIREDSMTLYGFITRDEKQMFTLLTTVTGIGPKLAINILSGVSVSELALAIGEEDEKRICSVPGVGKKMAQRIILELKDKIKRIALDKLPVSTSKNSGLPVSDDAEAALTALGYKPELAKDTVYKTLKSSTEELTVEELIRESLKSLVR